MVGGHSDMKERKSQGLKSADSFSVHMKILLSSKKFYIRKDYLQQLSGHISTLDHAYKSS